MKKFNPIDYCVYGKRCMSDDPNTQGILICLRCLVGTIDDSSEDRTVGGIAGSAVKLMDDHLFNNPSRRS